MNAGYILKTSLSRRTPGCNAVKHPTRSLSIPTIGVEPFRTTRCATVRQKADLFWLKACLEQDLRHGLRQIQMDMAGS